MRYRFRKILVALDGARASEQGNNLDQAVVETRAPGAQLRAGSKKRRDLSDVAGSWLDDPLFDEALAAQDGIE